MFEPVLTRNIHRPDSEKILTYLAHGGYEAVRLALAKSLPKRWVGLPDDSSSGRANLSSGHRRSLWAGRHGA